VPRHVSIPPLLPSYNITITVPVYVIMRENIALVPSNSTRSYAILATFYNLQPRLKGSKGGSTVLSMSKISNRVKRICVESISTDESYDLNSTHLQVIRGFYYPIG
jgi:hypothetical protein